MDGLQEVPELLEVADIGGDVVEVEALWLVLGGHVDGPQDHALQLQLGQLVHLLLHTCSSTHPSVRASSTHLSESQQHTRATHQRASELTDLL